MLTVFNRLLPSEGLTISPTIKYRDVADISAETREEVKKFFEMDREYQDLIAKTVFEEYSPVFNRRFCIYVYYKDELLGNLIYKEILNHPLGYSANDFMTSKRIFPKFRRTKYSRYAAGDMLHMLFKSDTANRVYSYIVTRKDAPQSGNFWELADFNAPCAGVRFKTDGPRVQRYINIKQRYATSMVVEFDGLVYNTMNLRDYFLAPGNRTEEMVDKWLEEMDNAAKIVKDQLENSHGKE